MALPSIARVAGIGSSGRGSVRISLNPAIANSELMKNIATTPDLPGGVGIPRGGSIPSNTGGRSSCRSSLGIASRMSLSRRPVLFERAAPGWWWRLQFDSPVLEMQFWRTVFPHLRRRFQYALIYLLVASSTWGIYLAATSKDSSHEAGLLVGSALLVGLFGAILSFTYNSLYQQYHLPISLVTVFLLYSVTLLLTTSEISIHPRSGKAMISPVALYAMAIQVILVVYAATPLPLSICVLMGTVYSIVFEVMSIIGGHGAKGVLPCIARILLHLALHLIGAHILLLVQVRLRSTFMKVATSLVVRRDLEMEKQLKEKMILSVMPPKVAEWLMQEGPAEDDDLGEETDVALADSDASPSPPPPPLLPPPMSARNSATNYDIVPVFRPFNMNRMENVSILFADIVGFTKMSSNKSAATLVDLLNDLFGRFDMLCEKLGCEKISTLGDCYYCVSGCPEPRPDHARCCADMGLAMIVAIRQFDRDTGENVNMRVGVHTGTVLCGIVGTKRFKFDVWSNDVTLANKMESTGRAGRVHVSQSTYEFLKDDYYMEDGDLFKGIRTHFIIGRRTDVDNLTKGQTGWLCSSPKLRVDSGTPIKLITARQALTDPNCDIPLIDADDDDAPSSILVGGVDSVLERQTDALTAVFERRDASRKLSRWASLSTINSRKDSGIRSRRSSIQQQLLESMSLPGPENLQHRVSGYYTSSQHSLAEPGVTLPAPPPDLHEPGLLLGESLTRCHALRRQSDIQLVQCLQDDVAHTDYFLHPPLCLFTLRFHDKDIESDFRTRAHRQDVTHGLPTLASPRFNTYLDVLVSTVTLFLVIVAGFLLMSPTIVWIVMCALSTTVMAVVVLVCLREILQPARSVLVHSSLARWLLWQLWGAGLLSLPILVVLANPPTPGRAPNPQPQALFYFCCLVFVAIVHYCNFIQLSSWMKSFLATLGAISSVLVFMMHLPEATEEELFTATPNPSKMEESEINNVWYVSTSELIIEVLLLLLLVWFLNREFEIGYRLCFHGNLTAARDQQKVKLLKDQADWLLHNIIPRYVAKELKHTSRYSDNHKDAGLLFASITNFTEMYDESYLGGKECLRVLNEVIADFDELLHRRDFRNVEKIKTIGATFMAASGLNPRVRSRCAHPHQHVWELMEFALAMQEVITNFNRDLLNFNFELRIGFNYGDVTAGVIGTTKLYYDIWGDTVNIASRMESTGVAGRVQVPEETLKVLQEWYTFEPRGPVFVKGKDDMNVSLLVGRKDGAVLPTAIQPASRNGSGQSSHSS